MKEGLPLTAGSVNRKHNARAKSKKIKLRKRTESIDYTLFFVVLILVMFGLVMVFSSSYYYTLTRAKFGNDMYYFVKRQLVWAGVGVVAMLFMMDFSYKKLRHLSFLIYIFAIISLALVLVVGQNMNGSKRWLGIGPIGFQPSEVAKFAIILFLSHYIAIHKGIMDTWKGFFKCCVVLGIPTLLVSIENLSTAIVIAAIGCAIMFVSSKKVSYFVAMFIAGCGGVFALVKMPMFAYRSDRIKYWLNPFADATGKGFQIIQSLYAVASGGMFGLGLGQSRQKTYVPEPYNDIIFAIICEELGLFGAILVILLFAVLVWRGIRIAMNADDLYGCLVAVGITVLIGVEVAINISVATNVMPNTGMALPFISYGGSALVFTMSSMGILLNISKYQKKQ
jgi:cell division protein FtsW